MPLTGLTTLGALVTAAALRADQPTPSTTTFITTANWYTFVNGSCQELHDKLIEAYGADYRVTLSSSITTTASASTYALPDGFYKLLGVDLQVSTAAGNNGWVNVPKFNFEDRNRYAMSVPSVGATTLLRYRLSGDNLWLTPQPPANLVLKVWYAPRFTPMTADGDTFDGVSGWEEYVINSAAMKALVKEESDISGLMALQAVQDRRLATIIENRDAGSPATVVDVYNQGSVQPGPGWGGWGGW